MAVSLSLSLSLSVCVRFSSLSGLLKTGMSASEGSAKWKPYGTSLMCKVGLRIHLHGWRLTPHLSAGVLPPNHIKPLKPFYRGRFEVKMIWTFEDSHNNHYRLPGCWQVCGLASGHSEHEPKCVANVLQMCCKCVASTCFHSLASKLLALSHAPVSLFIRFKSDLVRSSISSKDNLAELHPRCKSWEKASDYWEWVWRGLTWTQPNGHENSCIVLDRLDKLDWMSHCTSLYQVGIDDSLLNTKSSVTEEPWHGHYFKSQWLSVNFSVSAMQPALLLCRSWSLMSSMSSMCSMRRTSLRWTTAAFAAPSEVTWSRVWRNYTSKLPGRRTRFRLEALRQTSHFFWKAEKHDARVCKRLNRPDTWWALSCVEPVESVAENAVRVSRWMESSLRPLVWPILPQWRKLFSQMNSCKAQMDPALLQLWTYGWLGVWRDRARCH